MFLYGEQEIPDGFMVDGYDHKVSNVPIGCAPIQTVYALDYQKTKERREAEDLSMLQRLVDEGLLSPDAISSTKVKNLVAPNGLTQGKGKDMCDTHQFTNECKKDCGGDHA